MIPANWRRAAQANAAPEHEPAQPTWWLGEPPACSEGCPHHDGKRCRLLGLRAPQLCEPVITEMVRMLDAHASPAESGREP